MTNKEDIVLDALSISLPVQVWYAINELLQLNFPMKQAKPFVEVIEGALNSYNSKEANPVKTPEPEVEQVKLLKDCDDEYIVNRINEFLDASVGNTGHLDRLVALLKELKKREIDREAIYASLDNKFTETFGFSANIADKKVQQKELDKDVVEYLDRNQKELPAPNNFESSNTEELIEKLNSEMGEILEVHTSDMEREDRNTRCKTEAPSMSVDRGDEIDIDTYLEISDDNKDITDLIEDKELGDNSEYLNNLQSEIDAAKDLRELKVNLNEIRRMKNIIKV